MQMRTPAAAGMFYPGEENQLKQVIHDCYFHEYGPGEQPIDEKNIVGIICPHAGYMYSGPIACHSLKSISAKDYELFILIGPNHWGLGCNVSTMKDCQWNTPLGNVDVDSDAVNELKMNSDLIELDFFAHTKEHSLAVVVA